MLFIIYVFILIILSVLVVKELFAENDWRKQIALVMVLIPFILRILQIK